MELELEHDEDFLNMFFPCLYEHIPLNVRTFFQLLTTKIELSYGSMGDVGFRDSKNQTFNMFKDEGYDPIVVGRYIEEYETLLQNEYYEAKKKDQDKPT